jgi:hypothetical protein
MVWQVLAMWMLVVGTTVWFVRDERRLIANAALAQAKSFNARQPRYRYQSNPAPAAAMVKPVKRSAALTRTQREFLQAYAQSN